MRGKNDLYDSFNDFGTNMDGQHHHQHMDGHWGVPNLPPPAPVSFNFFIDLKKIIIIVEFFWVNHHAPEQINQSSN